MYNSGEYNFQNKDSIKNILLSHGYPVSEGSNYINTAALWRQGNDPKSVGIYYGENLCLDFVDGSKFDIRKLISLVTNQLSSEELDKYLKNNNIVLSPPSPKIKQIKIFSSDVLKSLIPLYDYWESRGISKEVLIETKGGIFSDKGILKNRFVFPVLNSKSQVVGLAGRDTTSKNDEYKWVLRGTKSSWCYPAFINSQIIKDKKSVFLVESIGDYLSLKMAGIDNILVLFGTELNLAIINYLLKINIEKIYLCLNDDSKKNMAGNKAADKAYKRLTKYFSNNQVKIVLPKGFNDWNDILVKSGKQEIINQLKDYIR